MIKVQMCIAMAHKLKHVKCSWLNNREGGPLVVI